MLAFYWFDILLLNAIKSIHCGLSVQNGLNTFWGCLTSAFFCMKSYLYVVMAHYVLKLHLLVQQTLLPTMTYKCNNANHSKKAETLVL